jgi:gliding motility-associated-like protein
MKRIVLVVVLSLLPVSSALARFVPMLPGQPAHAIGSIGDLTLNTVYPRIFTPNGDGYNDKVTFNFTNPEALPLGGKIYNLPGAQVANLSPGSDPTSQLVWDGKDSDGRTVPGGIYLYEVDFQGKAITGTVVVAR